MVWYSGRTTVTKQTNHRQLLVEKQRTRLIVRSTIVSLRLRLLLGIASISKRGERSTGSMNPRDQRTRFSGTTTLCEMECSDTDTEEHISDCDCDECLDADPDFTECEESTDSEEYETGDESGCDNTDSEIDFY